MHSGCEMPKCIRTNCIFLELNDFKSFSRALPELVVATTPYALDRCKSIASVEALRLLFKLYAPLLTMHFGKILLITYIICDSVCRSNTQFHEGAHLLRVRATKNVWLNTGCNLSWARYLRANRLQFSRSMQRRLCAEIVLSECLPSSASTFFV